MNTLHLSENLIALRRKQGITQDELASFLGVTKASVSKWETKTSFPDIMLLPSIASYFNVTIDELIGYEAELSPEQIEGIFKSFVERFPKEPCQKLFDECRQLIHEYYSCYPFLIQMIGLWFNHLSLLPKKEEQMALLNEMDEICEHILSQCKDINLCNNTMTLRCSIYLFLGKPKEVIEIMEPAFDLSRMNLQTDSLLTQAYQMTGQLEKADYCNQMYLYAHVLGVITSGINQVFFHLHDAELTKLTLDRIGKVIDAFDIEHLHTNAYLQFQYVSALYYSEQKDMEKALSLLTVFVEKTLRFLNTDLSLHGDHYFTKVEEGLRRNSCQVSSPRSKRIILESLFPAFQVPSLLPIMELPEGKKLLQKIEEELMKA